MAICSQSPASSQLLEKQNSSNAAHDIFHSVNEEPSPYRQQLVPVTPHDATEMEISITEATSANRDPSNETPTSVSTSEHATAQQQQQQSHLDSASYETPHSTSPNGHSTPTTQTKINHKGKTKKAPKCTIFVDKDSGYPILSSDSIVNLKRKKLIAIEHACEFPKSKTCFDKLADAQKLKSFNDFNIKLATPRVLENKWKMLNFDEEQLLSS